MAVKKVKQQTEDMEKLERQQRLTDWEKTGSLTKTISRTKVLRRETSPNREGLGHRSQTKMDLPWRTLEERTVPKGHETDASKVIDPTKVSTKLAKASDYIGTYLGHNGVLRPEYDVLEPFVIYDTEVFVKQAINRRLALMFRNGFELISDMEAEVEQGNKNVDYIQRRMDVMEYVTNRPTEIFFKDILFNLLLASNCFLRKIRDKDASPGVKQDNNEKRDPIAGYTIIPCSSIMPYFHKGIIVKWRRYFDTGMPYEDIPIHEIVHLKWDVKPGHVFGTPRTTGVRDDIFALRRLEENIELLFINHLFPLFHVMVGNEKAPCTFTENGTSEIDLIRYQIESMPKEGVFVTDERVQIDAIGAEGQSLDTKDLIEHLKGRVFVGMGVSALDLGFGDTANRSTSDNISQNLKDVIKADQEHFANLLRMFLFKEWFQEAPYSISVQKAVASTHMVFHEVDLDNMIKSQNHTLNMFNSHLITETEARKNMHRKPVDNKMRKNLHYDLHVKDLVWETAKAKNEEEVKAQKELLPLQSEQVERQNESNKSLMQAQGELEATKAMAHAHKAAAQTKLTHAKTKHAMVVGPPARGAVKKATPAGKAVRTKSQPTNQHGTNPGPTRAKSSRNVLITMLADNLLQGRSELLHDYNNGKAGLETWGIISSKIIDDTINDFEAMETVETTTNSYTRQIRDDLNSLKGMIAQTHDPELITILLDNIFKSEDNENINVKRSAMERYSESSTTTESYKDNTIEGSDRESELSDIDS